MFDVPEHLKEDACKIAALFAPGDQTRNKRFVREQNMETKTGKISQIENKKYD